MYKTFKRARSHHRFPKFFYKLYANAVICEVIKRIHVKVFQLIFEQVH